MYTAREGEGASATPPLLGVPPLDRLPYRFKNNSPIAIVAQHFNQAKFINVIIEVHYTLKLIDNNNYIINVINI